MNIRGSNRRSENEESTADRSSRSEAPEPDLALCGSKLINTYAKHMVSFNRGVSDFRASLKLQAVASVEMRMSGQNSFSPQGGPLMRPWISRADPTYKLGYVSRCREHLCARRGHCFKEGPNALGDGVLAALQESCNHEQSPAGLREVLCRANKRKNTTRLQPDDNASILVASGIIAGRLESLKLSWNSRIRLPSIDCIPEF